MPASTAQLKNAEEEERWQTIGARIKGGDVSVLNQRLSLYGYQSLGELVKDFIICKFPPVYDNATADKINEQASGQATQLKPVDYIKNVKDEEFYKFLIEERKLSEKYSTNIVSYVRRYYNVFFGNTPQEIHKLNPHKRSWILLSMRNFGLYYLRLTGSDDAKVAVRMVTERYSLNRGLDMGHNILIVEDEFVQKATEALLAINGQAGFYVKIALLTGLREDEQVYIHEKPICEKKPCKCEKLHVYDKANGLSVIVINWVRGRKSVYFTILPTKAWRLFRETRGFSMDILDAFKPIVKASTPVNFQAIRKISYNIMVRTMDKDTADVLAGRVKSVSAEHYAMYELDKLTTSFKEAWGKFGVGDEIFNDERLNERW